MDWVAWLDIADRPGGIGHVREALVGHRIHGDSETSAAIDDGKRYREDLEIFEHCGRGRSRVCSPPSTRVRIAATRCDRAVPTCLWEKGTMTVGGRVRPGLHRLPAGPQRLRKACGGRGCVLPRGSSEARPSTSGAAWASCSRDLPAGSMGLEINRATVEHCRARGWTSGTTTGGPTTGILRPSATPGANSTRSSSATCSSTSTSRSTCSGGCSAARALSVSDRSWWWCPAARVTATTNAPHLRRSRMLSDAAAADGTGYALTHTSYFPGNRRAIGDCSPTTSCASRTIVPEAAARQPPHASAAVLRAGTRGRRVDGVVAVGRTGVVDRAVVRQPGDFLAEQRNLLGEGARRTPTATAPTRNARSARTGTRWRRAGTRRRVVDPDVCR